MKSSMGGMLNVFLLLLFIIIMGSFLLFVVNYSKAYRVKNKIITALEQYEGNCKKDSNCYKDIEAYEKKLGYGKKNITCTGDEEPVQSLGYCYTTEPAGKNKYVYEVRTEIDMDFPLIREVMGVISGKDGKPTFRIHGKTKVIVKEE